MRSRLFSRLAQVAAGVVLLGTMTVSLAASAVGPEPGARRQARRGGFSLYAEVFTIFLVNRVACGINNLGEVCVDPGNSPIGGGGFWPKGTPDQYIFNSGVQVAGVIPAGAGFSWAGDTVGAYFMDPRGTQAQGDGVTPVYSSLDPEDAANWPVGGVVRDTSIFNSVLIGRDNISQQDLWVRAWDGNPNLLSGRTHPMGILVETRGLAWNFPSGNEDILYFVYTLYNVSASDPAAYSGLDPAIQGEIAAVGADFQRGVETTLGVDIPDGGYSIENVYAAFFMDPDVEDATSNYSTAVLPFQLAVAYKSNFQGPAWEFPPDIFGPPFAPAPGFVGVKYLRSPTDPATGNEVGLTIFSNTNNSATGFPDPVGVIQLWRYLSGNVSAAAGDNTCTVANPQARQLCYLEQNDVDTRFYQSSGPFTMDPGQSATIVVAYVHAAPVAAAITIGSDLKPGIPGSGSRLASGIDTLRAIDRAVGWVGPAADIDGNGVVEQDEVTTLPRSLLNKSLVAQAVFDNKFLLPFAPEPPTFFLVPGSNQVTVVWEPSATENVGDPFFAVANDNTSPLYDPNFRQSDVEGYRVYRGRTPGALQMIAQFDYNGTTFIDNNGAINYGNCAPELGVTTACPTFPNTVDISGDLVQVAPGARVVLQDGATVIVLSADTAVTGGGATYPPLTNTGVPFAFVDNSVINSFTYFYAVTAFDVNSVKSGPTSLESARVTQSVTPRAVSTSATPAAVVTVVTGDDDQPLNTNAPWPTIDRADGTFSGNIPATADGSLEFLAAVLEALPAGDITVQFDSVTGGFAGGFGPSPTAYFTMSAGNVTLQRQVTISQPTFSAGNSNSYDFSQPLVPYDSAQSRLIGLSIADTNVRMPVQFSGVTVPMAWSAPSVATASGRYGVDGYDDARYLAHSRWFDEGGSEPADPTIVGAADSSHNSGQLTGVGRIWSPSAYRQPLGDVSAVLRGYGAMASTVWYPADFVVTWGAGGTISVRDVSHNVTLSFATTTTSGYGFLNLTNILASGLNQADFDDDFNYSGTSAYNVPNYEHLWLTEPTCTGYYDPGSVTCGVDLAETAEIEPLDFDDDGTADATGIILIINGEPFYMEMSAVPAEGTEWHLRAVTGQMTATCTPSIGPAMTDCGDYTFTQNLARPTVVPGLRYKITVTQQYAVDPAATVDLSQVHTVPDPYYVTNSIENTPNRKVLRFVNLPAEAIIRVYSVSGVLVNVIEHNDPVGGGEASWNLRNRNNQFVASGVYFFHVEAPGGQEHVGRFTVVNFAQ